MIIKHDYIITGITKIIITWLFMVEKIMSYLLNWGRKNIRVCLIGFDVIQIDIYIIQTDNKYNLNKTTFVFHDFD